MISPAAQVVLDAYEFTADAAADSDDLNALATALRTAADRVVPRPPKNWELISCVSSRELEIRNQLLAIAAELEDAHD